MRRVSGVNGQLLSTQAIVADVLFGNEYMPVGF